ncbi:MAG TPA: glycosyltransferase family 2 protein [Candidatus Solibacter sp.]|nr:glycosyltransferase family 2 protein [Candidatus Solibacter sp.]
MASPNLTPVILTYNEEPNLARTLDALSWASRVIVLDSGSTDGTEALAKSYANVDWRYRRFDRHRDQWAHALESPGIDTEWVIALDADMVVSPQFIEEFRDVYLAGDYNCGIVSFAYRVLGQDLGCALYPPDLRLFRRGKVRIIQDGHTQRFLADGPAYHFRNRVVHDDRKPLDRWVHEQLRYSSLELNKMADGSGPQGLKSTLRKLGVMPLISGLIAYCRAGGPLNGSAALEYAYERLTFESILAMRVLRSRASDAQNSSAWEIKNV